MKIKRIKSELLFLSIVPIFLVFFLSFFILSHALNDKKNFEMTKRYIFELKAISNVVHFMQLERGLSIGYVTQNNFQKKDKSLQAIRKELDNALLMAKAIYETKEGASTMLTLLFSIQREREVIEFTKKSANEIKEHYSQKIAMLLTNASEIPTLMDDRQNRNFMQAFIYLSTAKEALGIIRATLNQSFTNNTLEERAHLTLQESLKIYNTEIERFKNTVSEDFSNYFEESLKEAKTEKTFQTIHDALLSKELILMPKEWFEEATHTIDFFKKVENALFEHVDALVESKLEAIVYQLVLISTLTFIFAVLLIIAIVTIVKRILSSANKLNEEHSGSLALLEQYKSAVDRSFIVSKTDAKGIITYVNDEFCKISGYSKEEIIGKSHNIIRHPDSPKALFREMWHTIKELKQPWFGEVQNLSKTKESYWIKSVINPILDKNGNVVEYIGIRIDITEIENAKEAALGAQRAKSAFLDTMSHELRTPLNAVIGFSQILMTKSDIPPQTMNAYVEKIYLSGRHLLGLVNNILDFSKIDSGKIQLHEEEIFLKDFIEKTILLVEVDALKKGISLVQEGFDAGTITTDEQLLKQVVLNILSNAIKFSDQNSSVRISHKLQGQNHYITICDEGIGLTQEQLASLFKPFSQIREHQNQAIKGTGLGLAISQKLATLLGGTITVDSTPNKGSCFSISLFKSKE